MTNVLANNDELTGKINEIYPSKTYTDYTKNLNFPFNIGLPEKIVSNMSAIDFNHELQYGGGSNLFDTLSHLYEKKILKRLHMKKIIDYYKKQIRK